MSAPLPACAPAANDVWCLEVMPFLQGIMFNNPTRCDVISRLRDGWLQLAQIAYHLSGGDHPPAPTPASTTEQALYGFWGDFIYSFMAIGKAAKCQGSGVQPPGALSCQGNQQDKFSYFANTEYCQGPYDTIAEAIKHTIFCVECVNGNPILGTTQNLAVVVDMDTGLKDIENLILGCDMICNKCPDDWAPYLSCCTKQNQQLIDRLQKIALKI